MPISETDLQWLINYHSRNKTVLRAPKLLLYISYYKYPYFDLYMSLFKYMSQYNASDTTSKGINTA